jgi:hypothetical protein
MRGMEGEKVREGKGGKNGRGRKGGSRGEEDRKRGKK